MPKKMMISRSSRTRLLLVLLLLVPLSSSIESAHAAATAISPTGGHGNLNTIVTPLPSTNICTANCVVTGGTRPGGGANLFHSFGQFNIGAGDITTFQNGISFDVNGNAFAAGLPTSNILGRVTGGNVSSIYGTIQTSGFGNANLFLMNPAGFLFGPNATVNVGGMMTFTTADYLRLKELNGSNAGIFYADTAPTRILTSAPVAAFGFIGSNPAAITFEGGQLTVAEGAGLALVGGNINLVPDASGTPSSITAHGRPILNTSVAGPGEVAVDSGVPAGGMALGTITLGQGAMLDTSGDPLFGDGSGGPISIRGGQFVATGATITTSRATGTLGAGGAVTVDVTGSATFTDSTIQTSTAFDFSFVGGGGAVSITANEGLAMTGTTIDTNAFFSSGDAGSVTLKSLNGPVSLTDSTIQTTASAPGNGGAVTITGKDVLFTRSRVDTSVDVGLFGPTIDDPALGLVRPGAVTVAADDTVTFSDAPSSGLPVIQAIAIGTLLDAGSVTITGKTVNLSNGTFEVSMSVFGEIPSPGNGGTIEIRGNNVNLSQFTLTSDNGGLLASTGKGGNILLRGADHLIAENIQLTNSFVNATSVTGGGAGNIEFQTKTLTLSDTQVRANTFSVGPGGSIMVNGAQTVTLQSNSIMDTSAIVSGIGNEGPFGTAGSILLETQQLTMEGGSRLRAADLPTSQGNAGSITVQGTNGPAQSILIDGTGTGIFTDAEGNGAGGNIFVNANTVTIQNGGALSATTSGTVPAATGGSILVKADTVTLATGGTMTAKSTGAGASGEVIVQGLASPARTILIDGAGSGIFTDTEGTGAGGNIFVNANSVTLQNGGALSAQTSGTETTATGGSVIVNATDRVTMAGGASITASSTGPADAGNISSNAGQLLEMQNSSITTRATHASGGNIDIQAVDLVRLGNSTISASVEGGPTTAGGNITIDPNSVILQNSQITAEAVQGAGGNISITTNLLLPDANSVISASSQFGAHGNITIQSPNAPASGKIQPLGKSPLLATTLLNQRCAALAGGEFSSFTVAGRDSLPAEPGSWLASPLALASENTAGTVIQRGTQLSQSEPAKETPVLSLRQIAPAGFLTQAFAVDWSAGCQS